MTKPALPVPELVRLRVRFCDPPGARDTDSGRGPAESRPAASAKSRRTVLFGITVAFFVDGSCCGKAAANDCAPLSENRM